jgi:hypothetical protein
VISSYFTYKFMTHYRAFDLCVTTFSKTSLIVRDVRGDWLILPASLVGNMAAVDYTYTQWCFTTTMVLWVTTPSASLSKRMVAAPVGTMTKFKGKYTEDACSITLSTDADNEDDGEVSAVEIVLKLKFEHMRSKFEGMLSKFQPDPLCSVADVTRTKKQPQAWIKSGRERGSNNSKHACVCVCVCVCACLCVLCVSRACGVCTSCMWCVVRVCVCWSVSCACCSLVRVFVGVCVC